MRRNGEEKKQKLQRQKKMKNSILCILISMLANAWINAQALKVEPSVSVSRQHEIKNNFGNSRLSDVLLSLPFFEDFSNGATVPSLERWMDKSATVNGTLPVLPPSIGVATLDGTDANGLPYQNINVSGAADTLTSRPFLMPYTPGDSLYISFFYQPGGRGNFPEFIDSLILEFYSPSDSLWNRVWGVKGEDYPQNLRPFSQAIVPVIDSSYLIDGFRFRFRNFAQLNGSWDNWHIDYIKLAAGRNKADTLFNDYSFLYPASSLIDFYQSVPLWHFIPDRVENMLEFFNLSLTSLKLGSDNIAYGFDYYNAAGEKVDSVASDPQGPIAYRNEYVLNESVKYFYEDPGTETTVYHLNYFLEGVDDDYAPNDTLKYEQVFSNYYALDDGSAEARLNINNPSGGFAAQRFECWVPDTLKAVQFYFNRTLNTNNGQSFYLMVWAAGSNQPGTLLLEKEVTYPDHQGLNVFHTYTLDTPVPLPAGTYYIGWAQINSTELNLGFDLNVDNSNRIYYNLDGNWYPYTSASGTLMMRPVFRYPYILPTGNEALANSINEVHLYPNPATDYVKIKLKSADYLNWSVWDISGKMIKSGTGLSHETIPVDDLSEGLYFMRVATKLESPRTLRFIKSK